MIVAVPFAFAVTSPADETEAFVVSEDAQVTVGLAIVLSFASFTVGVRVAVSAKAAKLTLSGDSVTDEARCDTVAVAVALADPDVAVMVAEPFATEVTKPAVETVATVVSDVAHVTVGLAIVLSFASFTVATSVAVSANEAKLRLPGDRVTDEAT